MNPEGREADNVVAQAMRDLAGMRGVNQQLRSAPPLVEAPPLSDDDIIEQFRRDTGMIINSNGEVIGQDPNWPGASAGPAPPSPPQQAQAAPAQDAEVKEETPLFGLTRKRGIQIDLQRGLLTIDGAKHELEEREVAILARFAIEVRARALSKDLAFLQKSFGVTELLKEEKEQVEKQQQKSKPSKKEKTDGQQGAAPEAPSTETPVDDLGEGGTA